ncbi:MAG: hypothetical protein ABIY52_05380 [Gemmatimonadaceae bacterium]
MELRGSGDRWLAGERLDGVAFAHHARVLVKSGAFEGKHGLVALLLGLGNDPLYIVKLSGGADVRVRQSSLTSDEGH